MKKSVKNEDRKLACPSVFIDVYYRSTFISSGLGYYLSNLMEDKTISHEEVPNIARLAFGAMNTSAYVGCRQGQKMHGELKITLENI